jgi:hypothetical protein
MDYVVNKLIEVCLAVCCTDNVGRMDTTCLKSSLEKAGFIFLGKGSSRVCVQHKRTRRTFKVTRWIDEYKHRDNEEEFKRYYGMFNEQDREHFAKPIALYWDDRILETKRARGKLGSQCEGEKYWDARSVVKLMQNRYDLSDMHGENFFVYGKRVTIVDYAI